MRIPKWLKRDKSNRRCSDSHAVMFNDSFSPRSDNTEDPIRTEEYKRDLAEFFARRSLGPIDENISHTRSQHGHKRDDRKPRSEKKSKRFSLPDTQIISSNAPNIQFSFCNQLYLNGNGKKSKNRGGSMTSTSPDLLPPRFIRNKHVDFEGSENPASPPNDFFKDSSLPYFDRDTSQIFRSKRSQKKNSSSTKNSSLTKNSPSPILDQDSTNDYKILKDSSNWSGLDDSCDLDKTDASFDSVMRKLEQMCQTVKPNFVYFRGVPLVQNQSITFLENHNTDVIDEKNIHWNFALWKNVPVTVKNTNLKKHCPKEKHLNQHIFTDIDILTKIRHSNILLLMGLVYKNNLNVTTIFEESIGSLYDYIHKKNIKLSPYTIISYVNGITNALIYLNFNNYVHTSVSSHSIMLASSNTAKLCDFELCSPILSKNDLNHEVNSNVSNIYKLNYSSEPEYENVKEFQSQDDESDDTSDVPQECSPQDVTARGMFSYYRWQAPELFDNIDNLVYPCDKTDVYSLCIVLWECFNNSIPWKTLSYKQLSNLYLRWNTGINLHQKDLYPQIIYEILLKGLNIKPAKRFNIHEIQKKITMALDNLISEESLPKDDNCHSKTEDTIMSCDEYHEGGITENESKTDINAHSIPVKVKNVAKFQVTNLDEEDGCIINCNNHYSNEQFYAEMKEHSVNLSSLGMSTKSLGTESYMDNSYKFHNTDSTEYCTLLSPDVKNLTKRTSNVTINVTPKISVSEDTATDKECSVNEKILKLNTSLTPKLYKSLHIQSPSADTINSIRSLTNSFECKNDINKSTYSFDIQNTSLPMTPIARNNKIKKNAWLSGKSDETTNIEIPKFPINDDFKESYNVDCLNKTTTLLDIHLKNYSDIDTQTELHIPESNSYRSSVSLNTDIFLSSQRSVGTLTDDLNGPSNFQTFRRRSYSLNSKSSLSQKHQENVTGVDIKPLVAIHEKWIMEARTKHGRSFSLPDNYRGLYAVKPASHLTDPARPKQMGSNTKHDAKNDKMIHTGCYSDISPLVRPAVTKKRILNANPIDFFENSLWRKEKEKCLSLTKISNDPQSSSTPKNVPFKKEVANDKSTNTESIDELYRKMMYEVQKNNFNEKNLLKDNGIKNVFKTPEILNDSALKNAKTSVIAELTRTFETVAHSSNQKNKLNPKDIVHSQNKKRLCDDEHFNQTVTLNRMADDREICEFDGVSVLETRKIFDRSEDNDDFFSNDFFRSTIEEDCISLPDNTTQTDTDDVGNKLLKRCQAFPALQDARSTEDMYIDDELMSNADTQTLSENVRLIPLQSNVHEATCDKGSECCLLKLQFENKCNRILLFCDEPNKNKDKCSYSSDEEEELLRLTSIESHMHLNLIDVDTSRNKLSVIEEKSDEDGNTDRESVESEKSKYVGSNSVVQDLISLYEGEEISKVKESYKNDDDGILNKKNTSKSEISIIIMDDELESSNKTSLLQNMYEKNVSSSLIEDIIHV